MRCVNLGILKTPLSARLRVALDLPDNAKHLSPVLLGEKTPE